MGNNPGQLDVEQVYLGFWINWTQGQIRGATVTITRRNGDLLIAFLALFTAWIGKSWWRIACFCVHNALSTSKSQDGLYHQRQAILRNSGTAMGGAYELILALWAWRGRARRSYMRLLPVIALAAITSAAFSVAGIFSSHVADTRDNQVLISSKNCGVTFSANMSTEEFLEYEVPYTVQRTMMASNYALQCYSNASSSSICDTYVKSSLPRTILRNASCPFEENMCLTKSSNIFIDTGYLNSLTDLGINGRPGERFLYRFTYHCAPLVTDGYSQPFDASNSSATEPVMRYFYGNPESWYSNATFTYQYPLNATTNLDRYTRGRSAASDYSVDSVTAYATDDPEVDSDFTPISQLQRSDADVSLLFLSANAVKFKTQTDDPWYSAHRPGSTVGVTGNSSSIAHSKTPSYYADKPVGVLGCARQFQMCNPALPKAKRCGSLGSARLNMDEVLSLWSTDFQKNLISNSADIMSWQVFVEETLKYLGSTALTARYRMQTGVQGPLPPDQWQAEVEHWHAISLATLQASSVEVATGPSDPLMQRFVTPPAAPEEKHFCKSQKVLSSTFSSFSVLGLGILLGVGSVIIILDYLLEPLITYLETRRDRHTYSRLEWQSNSTLQLQRLAHEAHGYGTWSQVTSANPVTKCGEQLSNLDIRNPLHPTLRGHGLNDIETSATIDGETLAGSPAIKEDGLKINLIAERFDNKK